MTTRLLVPTDGSDSARAALEHALDIAADREATVQLLYVADTKKPSLTRLGTDVVDVLEREGDEILDAAAALAEDRGVSVETDVVQGDPRTAIVEYTTGGEFDLVVMGAHGRRGIGEYVLGSTTDCVVNRSGIPVLTVRAADEARRVYPYGDVLVPTDGSDHASVALDRAASVAARHDATLHLLSVVDELPEVIDAGSTQLSSQLEENVQAVLDEAEATARRAGVDEIRTSITAGPVPREITSYVDEEEIDLVVMGTHGHTGLDRHLLGSFTERVIRTSPVPVLTTRRADELE
ncbi:universal stress protein [Natrinema versiforme]|uniref:Universal stress protein n=1 Tax=Natrinema versiforme TaxID=88724 RepID=A0A4P8WHK2_9EURY|nr:universal stress protein [Natrinema versiforme]QCS42625.1 universal stress protein [Natrinema versiforme]